MYVFSNIRSIHYEVTNKLLKHTRLMCSTLVVLTGSVTGELYQESRTLSA